MSIPFILFITGTSASGKTTLYESLRADPTLKNIRFHDIDENGVPPVGRNAWRRFRVEELLHEAVGELDKNLSTIVCGISKPHEVVESRYFKPSFNVHFLMIDFPYEVIKARIEDRVDKQQKVGEFDEVFNPDALAEMLLVTKNLLRELRNSISQQKNGYLLDASKLTKKQMHERAIKVIKKLSSQVS